MNENTIKQVFKNGKVMEYTLEELKARILPTAVINDRYGKNMRDEYRIEPYFEKTKFDDIKGEKWGKFADGVYVSDFGRVMINKKFYQEGKAGTDFLKPEDVTKIEYAKGNEIDKNAKVTGYYIAKQKDISYLAGYLQLEDWRNNFKPELWKVIKEDFIYQLVAKVWLKQPDDINETIYDVHHITNDGYDNRPENLIYLRRDLHNQLPKSK